MPDEEESKNVTLMVMERNFHHFNSSLEGDMVKIKCSLNENDFGFGYFIYGNFKSNQINQTFNKPNKNIKNLNKKPKSKRK